MTTTTTTQSINRLIEKSKTLRRGFTIVELLMVIGIISVLITITVSAVSGSVKQARTQRAKAICRLIEQGMATYYAREEKWPVSVLNNDSITLNADADGDKSVSEDKKVAYALTDGEVQDAIMELVKQTKKGSPVMDVSGLFVAKSGATQYGMDFTSAVRGTKKNPQGIRLASMVFGYSDPNDKGKFKRFKMTYSPTLDRVSVSL